MAFILTSTALRDGEQIPGKFTCDGENRSPELVWGGTPQGARSLAVILHDPDAPSGEFTHWLRFDIPPGVTRLPPSGGRDGVTPGVAGTNDFGEPGYGGPCPPPGDPPHRYQFTFYALDVPSLNLGKGATRDEVEAAMEGHVLANAILEGQYGRAG
jgi:Raf kinase inhibitor-like YbhB/YbcL family protein